MSYRPSFLVLSYVYRHLPPEWIYKYDIDEFCCRELSKDGNACMLEDKPIDVTTLGGLIWYIWQHTEVTLVFKPAAETRGYLGTFNEQTKTITVRSELNDDEKYRVLIHELVHYAQYIHGGDTLRPIGWSIPTRRFVQTAPDYLTQYKKFMDEYSQPDFDWKTRLHCEMEAFFLMEKKAYNNNFKWVFKTINPAVVHNLPPSPPLISKRTKAIITAVLVFFINNPLAALKVADGEYDEPQTLEQVIDEKMKIIDEMFDL